VGAESPGPKALDMLDLSRPDLDFAALAKGMGVPAARATTADELVAALERGLAEPGPFLVDAVLPPRL
jgi:acetolactate synthase-1/2/3 large subunit